MASPTPENKFIARVGKLLPSDIYAEKMANPYRGGTPDMYYEKVLDLWVEYKYIERLPIRDDTLIRPALTGLQHDWLTRNWDNGHFPWVIVGCPLGGVIFRNPTDWADGCKKAEFIERMETTKGLANAIYNRVDP